MVIQVNQELCSGCGTCVEACSVGAIQMMGQRAVINEALCTQCEACINVCPNGAIATLSIPARSASILAMPATESRIVPAQELAALPETTSPTRNLVPLAGAALTFLGREIVPRLADVLIDALERKLAQPKTTAISPLSTSPKVLTSQSGGKQRQVRYRGGRASTGNHQVRR